jgi:cell division protein FtsN
MKRRRWIIAGLVLIVAGLLGLRRSSDNTAVNMAPESPRPSPIERELPRLPLKLVANDNETVRTRVADTAQSAGTKESYENVAGTDWAVVAAIYRQYEAAERRAAKLEDLNGIRPSVHPAKGEGSKYMVVLGSGLTRAKAEELRARATNAGMPADTYVTRLLR